MSPVIDQLAELTGFRDRDMLDTTLVGALNDLLRPAALGVYRVVADGDLRAWHSRAYLAAGDVAARADALFADPAELPAVASHPGRLQCLEDGEIVRRDAPEPTAWFPLGGDAGPGAVLEVRTERPLGADEQRMVCSILRVYRNVQGLLDYSERDTLTGLLNRKTFDASFMRSASELLADHGTDGGRRHGAGTGCWLGVIDIDHFKRVNDTYGHLIGDEVLLLLSRLMRATFRAHDRLYRFGGEEFVVLVRCTTDDDAVAAFERFRAQTEGYLFPQVGRLTVSIGLTRAQRGDTPGMAFERADKAVYHAKANGRNQVHSHERLVADGVLEGGSKSGGIELF